MSYELLIKPNKNSLFALFECFNHLDIHVLFVQIDELWSRKDVLDFGMPALSWLYNKYWNHPYMDIDPTLKTDLVNATINLPFWYWGFCFSLFVHFVSFFDIAKSLAPFAQAFRRGRLGPDAILEWEPPNWLGVRPIPHRSDPQNINFQKSSKVANQFPFPFLPGHAFAENPDLRDLVFVPSGLTGRQMSDVGREKVRKWLDYREKYVNILQKTRLSGSRSYLSFMPKCK